ncbi:MAG: hypothetical protein WDN06_05355 [Asticcacaulis sp.]
MARGSPTYLKEIAEGWGVSEREAAARLQPGYACYFQIHEDDMRRILAHPLCMVGSDGLPNDLNPHPRLWGAFSARAGALCARPQPVPPGRGRRQDDRPDGAALRVSAIAAASRRAWRRISPSSIPPPWPTSPPSKSRCRFRPASRRSSSTASTAGRKARRWAATAAVSCPGRAFTRRPRWRANNHNTGENHG